MENPSRPVTGYPATAYPNAQSANGGGGGGGTAYYAAPPPQAAYYYPNPNPYYAQTYPDPRATFLRRLFGILIASFIVAGTIVFIIWLILRPRLPEFRVDSVTLSNFSLSSSSSSLITGNWDVRFTVRNPNSKITFSYDHIEAAVYYRDESLAATNMPPFVQGKKNQTTARATFAAASAYVDKRAADRINGERTTRRTVNFNVRMEAWVRYSAGAWRARRRYMRVVCGDLTVGVSSNSAGGSLAGGPKQCRVGL